MGALNVEKYLLQKLFISTTTFS